MDRAVGVRISVTSQEGMMLYDIAYNFTAIYKHSHYRTVVKPHNVHVSSSQKDAELLYYYSVLNPHAHPHFFISIVFNFALSST
jgi:hypothetical protein